jgi:hypothetical protein
MTKLQEHFCSTTAVTGVCTIIASFSLNDVALLSGIFASSVAGFYTLWKWWHAWRKMKKGSRE